MTRVVVANLQRKPRIAKTAVREKRKLNADGKYVRVLCLDANSPTFTDDLLIVFRKNVAKARRENKRLFGSADGFRTKK